MWAVPSVADLRERTLPRSLSGLSMHSTPSRRVRMDVHSVEKPSLESTLITAHELNSYLSFLSFRKRKGARASRALKMPS